MDAPPPLEKSRIRQKTFGELFPQLFLFPLLIVSIGVLLWAFLHAGTKDNRTVEQLIADIEVAGSHQRGQDVFALVAKLREMKSESRDGRPTYQSDDATRKLLGLLAGSGSDETLRKNAIYAVGRCGNPELTIPVMAEIALGEGTGEESRVNAVQALGLSRSPAAVDTLRAVIDRFSAAESWELRWNALAALANIGGDAAAKELRASLGDPRREVSWSAACWLANFFGDRAGIETLRNLTDWKFLDDQRGDHGKTLVQSEKELYMKMALEGLYKLEKEDALDVLKAKSRDTRSIKVQDAALQILRRFELEKSS